MRITDTRMTKRQIKAQLDRMPQEELRIFADAFVSHRIRNNMMGWARSHDLYRYTLKYLRSRGIQV